MIKVCAPSILLIAYGILLLSAGQIKVSTTMRKTAILIVFAIAVIMITFALLLSYPRFKRFEKRANVNLSIVDATFPVSERAAIETIKRVFKSGSAALDNKFDRFTLIPAGDQIFPSDTQIQAHSQADLALQQYLATAPALRTNDFYLYDPIDDDNSYWYSEYYYDGKPSRFRCNFIIHLDRQAEPNTRIEILEYVPKLWIGEKFTVSGHSGPGLYHDIREDEPTTTDRLELLETIKNALSSGPRKP